jgi:N-acetylneuraminic acid mutarotase
MPARLAFPAAIVALMALISPPIGHAHAPWLAVDEQGRALLFFGEGLDDRAYKLPDAIAAAKVFAVAPGKEPAELKLDKVQEEKFIGLRSTEPVAMNAALETTCEYGLYHGMLLTYYAKRLPGADATAWPNAGRSKQLKLDITPTVADGAITLTVAWNGKPLADADVSLTDASGELQEGKTDKQGQAVFKHIAKGPVAATASFLEDRQGEIDGKPFTSAYYSATLTFSNGRPKDAGAAKAPDSVAAKGPLPDLPEPLASFGAAVADGWLYVYGGHIGEEHEHSKDNLSQHFRRIEFLPGAQWEDLPMQTPLQGLPLVAYGEKLYRVGGLSARNATGDKEDLHSVDEFAAFDPRTNQWTALPPLPEPRSSHDATVIDGVLYVVGGWTLDGSAKGKWLDTAWSFDLKQPNARWQAIAAPGFRRRALAVSHWNDQLVALGGMNAKSKISRRVDALNLKTGQWHKLAKLPGDQLDGFGVAACNLDGKLYASGTGDNLFRLADDGQNWEAAAKLTQPRFFHRLVPGKHDALLLVAGASEEGHLASIEAVRPERRPALEQ